MIRKENSISHQFQTLMKKSRSRSGSLLILVVVILAVAMILITSALTLTVAARSRYYNDAVSSQASLTAASVAKTIASAAEIGDLSEDDLKQLVTDTQGTNRVTVTKTTTGGALLVSPGLEGVEDASGNTKTSLTELKVEYGDKPTSFIITVTTYLDAGSATKESMKTVTVFLEKNIPAYPTGFGATLNIYGNSQIPNVYMGFNAPADAESNFVTFTGTLTQNNGTTQFGGDVIVTNKIAMNANRVYIGGNLVLLGSKASLRGDSGGYMVPQVSLASYFLDICDAAAPGSTFWNDGVTGIGKLIQSPPALPPDGYRFTPKGILLRNASMGFTANNSPINMFMPTNLLVNTIGSGNVLMDGASYSTAPYFTVTSASDAAMNSLVTKYTNASGVVQTSLSFIPPASRYDLMVLLGLSPTYAPSGGTPLTALTGLIDELKALQNASLITVKANGDATVNGITVTPTAPLTAAAYYIATDNSIGNPIVFDLTNNNIDLFIVGNLKLDFTNQKAALRFIRPAGSTHIGRIIFMEDYAKMILKASAGTNKWYAGITGTGDATRYVPDDGGGTPISDGVYAGNEPYVYVYGFNNRIEASSSTYLEGYYGLFGPSGSFYVEGSNNKLPLTYARFDVNEMNLFGGNPTEIAYCPGPGEGTNTAGAKINPFVISGYITN